MTMDTGEESERLAWDLEEVAPMRRLGGRSTKNREALRRRFIEEQAERRLAMCANAVTKHATRRTDAWTLIVALLSFLILVAEDLPTITEWLK
jgi:hypothetical protein